MVTKTESRQERRKEIISRSTNRNKAWNRRRVTSKTKTI